MDQPGDHIHSTRDTPYAGLTPAFVLDALDSVGLRGDGRLLQLNSYENRVFQVFLEDGTVVVAKFYRPGRWSDEQILEEHRFSAELAQAEIPVVAPLSLQSDDAAPLQATLKGNPATLAEVRTAGAVHRFAVTPRRSGRAPQLESPEQLEWIGRFIGRMHAVGAREPFQHRLALTVTEFGSSPRDWLWQHDIIPPDAAPAWKSVVDELLDRVQDAFDRASPT
jgi:Ser/Thr protein kinase RdoA (MazF antagonist)